MGSPMQLNDFVRKMQSFGVTIRFTGDNHLLLARLVNGVKLIYVVAVAHPKKEVDDVYVRKARRRLKLLPEDGISDKEFNCA